MLTWKVFGPQKITYAKAKSNALKLHEGSYTAAPKPAPAPIAGPAAPPPPSGTKRPHEDDQSEENKRARSGEGPEAGTYTWRLCGRDGLRKDDIHFDSLMQ